ncbi:MAG: TRAP transporter small permease subunit [Rhizobiaceae bacterium]|nr:TRAP transporter small permease subunit [Hyphomicrobiales bacterium]NRB29836.1 TRAP transporter small permease subunit [Rhizobiaceae bacterium]
MPVAALLTSILRPFSAVLSVVLMLGRHIAWMALAVMVAVILLQVIMRYVFNNALAWPEEAARFCMLWMTGMIAPSAMRWGGFVAIEMLPQAMPKRLGHVLSLVLLLLSAVVMYVCIQFGWNHTFGFGGNFDASAMRIPLDWVGGESVRVKLRYMYGSLLFGVIMIFVVNIELILRNIILLLNPDQELPDTGQVVIAGAD